MMTERDSILTESPTLEALADRVADMRPIDRANVLGRFARQHGHSFNVLLSSTLVVSDGSPCGEGDSFELDCTADSDECVVRLGLWLGY